MRGRNIYHFSLPENDKRRGVFTGTIDKTNQKNTCISHPDVPQIDLLKAVVSFKTRITHFISVDAYVVIFSKLSSPTNY